MQGYGSRALRVFVLDDHDIVRRGLLDLLTKRDITVVGDTGSAAQATSRILRLRPDVMVLDVQLQDGSGVQVCRDVRAQDPSIQGLLLTAAADEEAVKLSILAGAAGAVVKLATTSNVVDAVRRLGAGKPLLEPAVTGQARNQLRTRAAHLDPPLTPLQAEMLRFVLAGHTDQQIAAERQQSPALIRAEVAQLIGVLTTQRAPKAQPPGRHRRDP